MKKFVSYWIKREWGAVSFFVTVIIGIIVVPVAFIIGPAKPVTATPAVKAVHVVQSSKSASKSAVKFQTGAKQTLTQP
jgi:hypothetical protein